jgi:hypothetical protein
MDGGRLWDVTLCGPVMFVDPISRALIANVRPGESADELRAGLFATAYPVSENIANTSVEWMGTLWTQVSWPLPENSDSQHVLLLHESFHRLQAEQKWPFHDERGINAHMDTFEGRYLMQLEWRALA